MTLRHLAFAAVALPLSAACGGGKPPEAPPPSTKERAPLLVARPAPLTPATAPADLFALARVKNPGALLDTVSAWSGVRLDWRKMLAREAPDLGQLFVTGAPVDFAAVIDPASTFEPKILYAFSFGVSSADAIASYFRRQGGAVTDVDGSSFRARVGDSLLCLAGPALGAAPARVVCSDQSEGVDLLAPYLTRGLSTETLGPSEIHAEVLAEPFRKRYGSRLPAIRTLGVPFLLHELALNDEKFDRALAEVLKGLADEGVALARDASHVDFDVAIQGNDATVSLELALAGAQSFTSRAMTRVKANAGPPPDLFWGLPGDATSASFVRSSSPDLVKPVVRSLTDLADAWLEHYGLPELRRAPLMDALEGFFETSPTAAFASIPVPETAATTPAGIANVMFGDKIWVVDGGGDRLVPLATAAVKAISDKAFRERIAREMHMDVAEEPVFRERAPRGVKDAPKGARVFEVELPAKKSRSVSAGRPGAKTSAPKDLKRPKEAPLRVVLALVPDGSKCWIALGLDDKAVFDRVRKVREPGPHTLVQREGLASLREGSMVSGGFTSLSEMLGGLVRVLGPARAEWERLPHRGETPITWQMTVRAEGPSGRIEGRFPRAAVEDIASLVGGLL